MGALKILEAIKKMNVSIFYTNDIATYLNISTSNASHSLQRLAESNQVIHIKKGLWALPDKVDPLMLPEYLLAPFPSYISFQTALYYRNVIDQVPSVIYVATLNRSKQYETPIATVSAHQINADFFFGYTYEENIGIKMATAEKALIDILYLSPAKSKIFRALPELDQEELNWKEVDKMAKKIPSLRRRHLVQNKLKILKEKSSR